MNEREQKIFNDILLILKEDLEPSKIVLFGSRAKKSAVDSSDFDFAVVCSDADDHKKRTIKEKVEAISGLFKVDIVYYNDVDEGFQNIISKTGEIIYER